MSNSKLISSNLSNKKVNTALQGLTKFIVQAMDEAIEEKTAPPIEVQVFKKGEHIITIEGHVNSQLNKIIAVSQLGVPVCLFGGSGTGKTTIAKQLAEALEMPFYCQTVTAGMPESMLLGRQMVVEKNGASSMEYIQTPFLKAVEEGGVFLLDEFDAIDENCALAINNLLEFGYLNLPMRVENPVVKAHPEFRFIACANTKLNGASLIHNGRNQLDGATISRFDGGIFEIGYDLQLEKLLCPRPEIRLMFQNVRETIEKYDIRKEISTRTLKRAEMLWQTGLWHRPIDLLHHFTKNWSDNEHELIIENMKEEIMQAANKEMLSEEESAELEENFGYEEGRDNNREVAEFLDKVAKVGATELDE